MRTGLTTERFHVLMSADAVGGVWSYAIDLAAGLAEAGVGVTLAVLGPDPSEMQAAQAEAAGCRLVRTGHALDWTATEPGAVTAAGAALARLARAVGADIVHLHSPAFAADGGFDVPVVGVCHSCVATWWAALETGPLPPDLAWRADLVGRGCRATAALLAPSAAFAAATARAYGLPRPPSVVRNGRRPLADADATEAEAAGFVFTAGRLWDRGKNLAGLDRVAARITLPVSAAGPIAGPNGARIALTHLDLPGQLDEAGIAAELARRPIFVSLARYEPFGLAILEAAQAGCALVLSDLPTFRELWEGAALFVDADDADTIARILESLAADTRRRAALGEAARERAGRYTAAATTAGVLRIFEALLAQPVARASLKGAAA
ncbi:glycosyltransferase family 4 protein [Methylobacterium soli]|nr:glycosyltransferase family 4 protein [Methylobacterium soli]GJE41166.1 Phosphatidyl-myo-inositol mannosyltransferase [Methylobacterium soli]